MSLCLLPGFDSRQDGGGDWADEWQGVSAPGRQARRQARDRCMILGERGEENRDRGASAETSLVSRLLTG